MHGRAACSECAIGYYQSGEGQTSCVACRAGTHVASTGQYECKNCQHGKYSDAAGAAACSECEIGYYQSGGPDELHRGRQACRRHQRSVRVRGLPTRQVQRYA